jgi:hypothetical protein
MDHDLEILKVKNKHENENKKLFEKLHQNLLKPPFLLVVNGSVRSGKSTLLMNLIYNKHFYKDYFDKIVFVSPTVHNDETLEHLNEDEDIIKIHDDLDKIDTIVKTIVDEQDKLGQDKKHVLLILDDMLGYIKPNSYISNLCTRYRHRKLSIIITSQNFRKIPNIIRENASGYLIFKTTNKKEYKKYYEEFSGLFETFEELYNISTDKPYNFLYLDLRHIKAYHNFTSLLYSK